MDEIPPQSPHWLAISSSKPSTEPPSQTREIVFLMIVKRLPIESGNPATQRVRPCLASLPLEMLQPI